MRRLGRDERPGDTPPNALAIQRNANSDYRKEIVGGDFPKGPRDERGVARADAKADRRDAGTVQLRQRAPSSSQGECEAFGRWKPLFSEAE
ncbi:MAG: hypothetical protein ACLPSW_26670, partial [Roseiarcus sp.]